MSECGSIIIITGMMKMNIKIAVCTKKIFTGMFLSYTYPPVAAGRNRDVKNHTTDLIFPIHVNAIHVRSKYFEKVLNITHQRLESSMSLAESDIDSTGVLIVVAQKLLG